MHDFNYTKCNISQRESLAGFAVPKIPRKKSCVGKNQRGLNVLYYSIAASGHVSSEALLSQIKPS